MSHAKAVPDRWTIKEFFHDVKEVWGTGQQQVRNLWSSLGCRQLNGWLYTLAELTSCNETMAQALLSGR